MHRLRRLVARLHRDQAGATAMEYGLIIALLSVVVIGGVTAAGTGLFTTMGDLSNRIAGR